LRYYYHYNIATIQYCNKCKIAMITTYPWLKCCHYLLQYCHDCNVLININSTLSKVVSKKKPIRIEPRLQTPPLLIKLCHCPIICMPHCWIGLLVYHPTVLLSQCPIMTVSPWSIIILLSHCLNMLLTSCTFTLQLHCPNVKFYMNITCLIIPLWLPYYSSVPVSHYPCVQLF